jgi:hypothetical protein
MQISGRRPNCKLWRRTEFRSTQRGSLLESIPQVGRWITRLPMIPYAPLPRAFAVSNQYSRAPSLVSLISLTRLTAATRGRRSRAGRERAYLSRHNAVGFLASAVRHAKHVDECAYLNVLLLHQLRLGSFQRRRLCAPVCGESEGSSFSGGCIHPPSRPVRRVRNSSSMPKCSTKGIAPALVGSGVMSSRAAVARSPITVCGKKKWPPMTGHSRTSSYEGCYATYPSQFARDRFGSEPSTLLRGTAAAVRALE